MLRVENLRACYGLIEAVKGISFRVDRGEIVTLIGGNGAGKTTTLMTLSGVISPSGGKVFFEGEEISGISPHKIVSLGISQVPEGRRIFPKLTVLENLELGGFTRSRKDQKEGLEEVYGHFPALRERKGQQGGTLSGGEQQMLAIGRALMSRPKCMMMDEPSLGLSPIVVEKIFQMIQNMGKSGLTLLLVEQNARLALSVASRAYVMETGKIVKEGAAKQLMNDPAIKSAYLGE
ncbi:MAG TPA: ABC transporter ATP-binding protein [Nitrospiria bacterium]|nr:ABC transporter ATP-binding protein [Nitrospiria bacterium]